MSKTRKLTDVDHLACKIVVTHEALQAARRETAALASELGRAYAEVARLRAALLEAQVQDSLREAASLREFHELPQAFSVTENDDGAVLYDLTPKVLDGGKSEKR